VVYGFGEEKTPDPFVSACDKFIYLEILEHSNSTKKTQNSKKLDSEADKLIDKETANEEPLISFLKKAYEAVSGEDGWANLGSFGAQLNKLSPSFDSRNYGYKKLVPAGRKNPTIRE
jgi:uncharacterized LabA/DUF88 family protein